MTKLFIHLQSDLASATWLQIDSGSKKYNFTPVLLSEVPKSASDNEIIVLIPTSKLLLTSVKLPETSTTKQLQALPFALEDEVLDDVDKLHFTLGNKQTDGKVAVAVIAKELMHNLLEQLTTAGLTPDRIIPDCLALPFIESSWSIYNQQNIALVRTGKQSGFATDTDNLEQITSDNINKIPVSEHLLELAANNTFDFNLLQGEYKLKKKIKKTQKIWHYILRLTILLIVILIIGHAAQLIYYKIEQNKLQQQIQTTYFQIFPKAETVIDPHITIGAKLRRYSDETKEAAFLNLLAKSGIILNQIPKIKLQQLVFSNNKLQLQIQAANFSNIDLLVNKLRSNSLIVKRDKASSKHKFIQAAITVSMS